MMVLKIALLVEESTALVKLSQSERRDPRAQAALIIRRELQRAGLLAADLLVAAMDEPRSGELSDEKSTQ